ncbi:hypothetical protein B0A49_09898 [Cryomyces minteri]|uniref:MARVEL domain-containing protein n=1 Tax=Cryomyces minteri TaxID=331657 RepID=A0A4U0X1C4_9PEZI|nr:hypothetical protein B0A49_09898 [Cryomyces minteri]
MFISRRWRTPKTIIGLFVLEFGLTIGILALFGIAAPDLYRTRLWQDGADNGFNSSPNEILYSYANYKPMKVPLIWSQFITNFNIIIGVLSMFILLVKVTMYITHVLLPLISLLIHTLLVALYAVSMHAQASPDLSDPSHPQRGLAWYITKPCSVASRSSNIGYCQQAKASFIVTILMMVLFALHICLAVWSMVPTEEQKRARTTHVEMGAIQEYSPEPAYTAEQKREGQQLPRNLGTTGGLRSPMTPRTVAFNVLGGGGRPEAGGGLPLREKYGA